MKSCIVLRAFPSSGVHRGILMLGRMSCWDVNRGTQCLEAFVTTGAKAVGVRSRVSNDC